MQKVELHTKVCSEQVSPAFGNTLLAEGFTPIAEQKPSFINVDGSRAWVLAAWSENNQRIKVFADKIGTQSCTADYWKPL